MTKQATRDAGLRIFWVGISEGTIAYVHDEQKWATDYCLIEKKHYDELKKQAEVLVEQTKEIFKHKNEC